MIQLDYLNSIRNWLASGGSSLVPVASGALGTNRTTVYETDGKLNNFTNLGTSGTFSSVTGTNLTIRSKALNWAYALATGGTATGLALCEFGLDDGTLLFNRKIFEPITKKSMVSFNYVVNFNIE